jgi:large subunit ribosomal protein L6
MSRVGNAPISIPQGVQVEVGAKELRVKGPKGELVTPLPSGIETSLEDGTLVFSRKRETPRVRSLHGLVRSLAANAVHGVTEGFMKELEIVGIGYRASVQGREANFTLGYSHPVVYPIPEGIEIKVADNTKIRVEGIDKQMVGQVAAEIRALRPPDAYKGKGIRYKGELLRLKVGKTGVTGAM